MDSERVCVREQWRKIAAAKKCIVATWSTHTSEMTSHVRVRSVLDESRRVVKHVEPERARDFYAHISGHLPHLLSRTQLWLSV